MSQGYHERQISASSQESGRGQHEFVGCAAQSAFRSILSMDSNVRTSLLEDASRVMNLAAQLPPSQSSLALEEALSCSFETLRFCDQNRPQSVFSPVFQGFVLQRRLKRAERNLR
ncbi:unnamed protein product [Mycena citricolor]|uniref:Uncharacterized protein n=1 Tax=Mycena citricolor TaxID=2018698 RepID=A0AAD2H0Y8_9AGAR|nr:unnamed protein product [Mycena citricolor]